MLKLNEKQKHILKTADIVKMSHQARLKVSAILEDTELTNKTDAPKNPLFTSQK